MFKKSLLISSLILTLSSPVIAEINKTVVATVDGKDIIAQELIMTAEQNKIDYKALNDKQKKLLLNGLINRILVANLAKKHNLDKNPDIKLRLEALNDSVLAAAMLEKESKNVKISDADVKKFYESKIIENVQKKYKARHILVKDESEAKSLFDLLKTADIKMFEEKAKEKSIDKGSAVKGGDLGWFNPATMVPSFGKAVKAAKNGKLAEPVKSQFGWHLILVEDSKAIEVPSLKESTANIKKILTKEKITAFLAVLEKEAKIDIKIGK